MSACCASVDSTLPGHRHIGTPERLSSGRITVISSLLAAVGDGEHQVDSA
jgi:hypothetical protein